METILEAGLLSSSGGRLGFGAGLCSRARSGLWGLVVLRAAWGVGCLGCGPVMAQPRRGCSEKSHVIPLRLLQTLNLHRWNCNVFLRSRKITVLNYVRNLSGSGPPSPAVVAARPSHRLRALRPGPIAVGSSAPSMPEAVGVLQQKPRRGAPLMVQFPPFGGGEAGSQTGVVPKAQSTSANNGKNGVLWAKWSAFWAQLCRTWCVSA